MFKYVSLTALFFVLVGFTNSALAQSTGGPGGQIFGTGSDVTVTILPTNAAYTDDIYVYRNGNSTYIGSNQQSGTSLDLGVVPAGTELEFAIHVENTDTWLFMGPGSRNPDGNIHATVSNSSAANALIYTVGFEDVLASQGSDFDYNDANFKVAVSNGGSTPTPTPTPTPPVTSLPVVTLAATSPTAALDTGSPGVVTVNLSAPQAGKLTVQYKVKGSASNGTDYTMLSGKIKIKAGATSKSINIFPIGSLEGASKKTVRLIVVPEAEYTVGSASVAKLEILKSASAAGYSLTVSAITDPSLLAVGAIYDATGRSALLVHAEKNSAGNVTRISGFTQIHRDSATQLVDAWQTTVLGTNGLPQEVVDSSGSVATITGYNGNSCQVNYIGPSGNVLASNVTLPLDPQFLADFAAFAGLAGSSSQASKAPTGHAKTKARTTRGAAAGTNDPAATQQALFILNAALLPANWAADITKAAPNLEQLGNGVLSTTTTYTAGSLLLKSGVSVAAMLLDQKNGIDPNSTAGLTIKLADTTANFAGCIEAGLGITSIIATAGTDTPVAIGPTVVGAISCALWIVGNDIEVENAAALKNSLTAAQTTQLSNDLGPNGALTTASQTPVDLSGDPSTWNATLSQLTNVASTFQSDIAIAVAEDAQLSPGTTTNIDLVESCYDDFSDSLMGAVALQRNYVHEWQAAVAFDVAEVADGDFSPSLLAQDQATLQQFQQGLADLENLVGDLGDSPTDIEDAVDGSDDGGDPGD